MKLSELKKIIKEEILNELQNSSNTSQPDTPYDAKRFSKITNTPAFNSAASNINKSELDDIIKDMMSKFAPDLQPDKASLSTVISIIKSGLAKAGYK